MGQKADQTYLKWAGKVNVMEDLSRKKVMWRSIMSQKLGLREMKKLSQRGTEIQNMVNYNEKLKDKESRSNLLEGKIKQME